MIEAHQILLDTIVTEKATQIQSTHNKYSFKVHPDTNRKAVAAAIEETFPNTKVRKVNIINVKPKAKPSRVKRGQIGYKPGYKKAIVTLSEGAIELI